MLAFVIHLITKETLLMPFKYNQSRQHHIKKPVTYTQDWKHYNESLKKRGDITIWLSQDVINEWYVKDRIYDGTGTPNLYNDMAIYKIIEKKAYKKLHIWLLIIVILFNVAT